MILFSKFSDERSPELCVRTDILEENGRKSVRKSPCTPEASFQIDRIEKAYKALGRVFEGSPFSPNRCVRKGGSIEFEYLEGKTLEDEIDSILFADKDAAKKRILEYIGQIRRLPSKPFAMTEEFRKIFGNVTVPEGAVSLSTSNIDMVLSNIIPKDGWNVIDYEWTFTFPVPVSFIVWRALNYYIYGNRKRVFLIHTGIMHDAGISGEEELLFREMEQSFQKYILGSRVPIRDMDLRSGDPFRAIYSLASDCRKRDSRFKSLIYLLKDDGSEPELYDSLPADENGFVTSTVPVSGVKKIILLPLGRPCFVTIHTLTSDAGTFELSQMVTTGARIRPELLLFNTDDGKIEFSGWPKEAGQFLIEFTLKELDAETADLVAVEMDKRDRQLARLMKNDRINTDIMEYRTAAMNSLADTRAMKAYRSLMARRGKPDPFSAFCQPIPDDEQDIITEIDKVSLRGERICVQGWVLDFYSDREKLSVTDASGAEIPSRIFRYAREDAAKVYSIDSKRKLGFSIQFPNQGNKNGELLLRIADNRGYLTKKLEIPAEAPKSVQQMADAGELTPGDEWVLRYDEQARKNMAGAKELDRQRKMHFADEPLISIVIPLYNTPLQYLDAIISSVMDQTYAKVQLCLADGSSNAEAENFIREHYAGESRIVYKHLTDNRGISENTNEAIRLATGDFIMLSDHDDEVAPNACFEIVRAINSAPDVDAVFTDEDKLTQDSFYFYEPNFKPDFNLDYLCGTNYICHIFAVRKSIVDRAGLFRSEYDGAQDHDFILRCTEISRRICHVPMALYHWRSHPASTAANPFSKLYAYQHGVDSVQAHYDRLGIRAKVSLTEHFGHYRTILAVQGNPLVSVVIADRGKAEAAKAAVISAAETSVYQNYEIILVTSGTGSGSYDFPAEIMERVHFTDGGNEKNVSLLLNAGADAASGEVLLFLDPETKILTPNWIDEMLGYCQRADVGAVGAKTFYADGTTEHGGICIGMKGAAGYMFHGETKDAFTYEGRGLSTQDVSAVSSVCLMVMKKNFKEAGGFSADFMSDLRDADFGLRLRASGKLVVMDAFAHVAHLTDEGDGTVCPWSEGKEGSGRNEEPAFREKWKAVFEAGDPYFNPNQDHDRTDFAYTGQFPKKA